MKELTLELWIYQNIADFAIFMPTDLRFLELIGQFSRNLPVPKKLASRPPKTMIATKLRVRFEAMPVPVSRKKTFGQNKGKCNE